MFTALADPTRRAILARLASGEASVTELARPFAMSQPAISKHLKMLERAVLPEHEAVETLQLEEHDGKTTILAKLACHPLFRHLRKKKITGWKPVPRKKAGQSPPF